MSEIPFLSKTKILNSYFACISASDGKTVAITFDDGFLDNWLYAYPILKKYGLKATIFVVTARPLDSGTRRPNLEDVFLNLTGKKIVDGELN